MIERTAAASTSAALEVFQFDAAEVRVLRHEETGDPWFVGLDVCRVLSLRNPRSSLALLDEDDVHTMDVIDAMGRSQEMAVLSEAGLYTLILRSRRPEAKAFKRWITHDVIPSIRRSGGYVVGEDKVDRLAAALERALPPTLAKMAELDSRLVQMEARAVREEASFARLTDQRAVEELVRECRKIGFQLVHATAGTAQPVTIQGFWTKLQDHVGVSSFGKPRLGITVPMMHEAVAYARKWWEDRCGPRRPRRGPPEPPANLDFAPPDEPPGGGWW